MAVYTRLSDEEMMEVVGRYPIGRVEEVLEIPEGILNTNYLIRRGEEKYILRILEGRRDPAEEVKELALLNHLSENNFPCPVALKTKEDEEYVLTGGKMAALFTFIEGEKVAAADDISIGEIGRKLGQMHKLLRDREIKRMRKIEMNYFYDLISQADLRGILGRDYEKLMDYYLRAAAVDYSSLPQGIIHNDIFPDNVFMKNGVISGVIDFNDSMRGPLIMDLAIVINFWIRGRGLDRGEEERLEKHLISSYEGERSLTDMERELLDEAVLRSALTFIFLRVNKFYVEKNEGVNMEFKDYKGLLPLLDYF